MILKKYDVQTARVRTPEEEKYDRIDYTRVDCTCEIMKCIMRGFRLKFSLISPISTKLLLGGLLLQLFSQWLHSEAEQKHMVSGRWFMMTGLYREQYCITDEWFFMEVLYVKKYTAVPQLGLDRTKTGCSIRSKLSRGIAATNDCSDDLSFQYFWKILQSLIIFLIYFNIFLYTM